MTRDLRDFEPAQLARLDAAMWMAYYKHDFFKLFLLLTQLCYGYCKPNLLLTVRTAYYSAQAAIVFRRTKGDEDLDTILQYLSKFYELLANNNRLYFDHTKAAQAELEWWLVDRYPERYKKTRATALSEGMSAIYNIPAAQLTAYGQKREAAMLLIGKHHYDMSHTPDWAKIERLLNESYVSLHYAIAE